MPAFAKLTGRVYARGIEPRTWRWKGVWEDNLIHQLLDIHLSKTLLVSLSIRCSGWELLCVCSSEDTFRLKFTTQRLNSRFFWKRGKNLLLILQLAGARSLWAEIAENLLGTLETIFNGRRHRNDFNILRSMGNSSPTITVSHLGGGMNRKKRIKKWKVANLRNIDFLRWNRGKKSLCRKFDLIWFWMAPQ